MWRHWKWLIMLILLGAALRLIGFGSVPVSPYWDEMAIWDDARSIAETGRDVHNRSWFQPLFISYGDYKLPVYIWFTALASAIVPEILAAVRLPSLLAGISMIPGIFFLTRFLFLDKKWKHLPLFSAFFLAVLPWSIHFSRVGFEGHVGAAFLLWSTVCLWWGIRQVKPQKQWLGFLLSALLGTAAVYSYFSVRFVFPIVFLTPLILWFSVFRHRWLQFVLALGLWAIFLIPMYRADFYQASNQYRLSAASILNQPDRPAEINLWRQRSGNTIVSRVLFNRSTFLVRDLALNYSQFLDPSYLWISGDANLRHGVHVSGIMFFSSLPLFIAGIFGLIRQEGKKSIFLFVWWLAAILPAAVPTDVPHSLRSLNALPVFGALLGFGGIQLLSWWDDIKSALPKLGKLSVAHFGLGVFVGLMVFEIIRYEYAFLTVYPQLSSKEWQDGYLQVAQYVQENRDNYTFVYVDSFDDRFFLYYQPYSGVSWKEIQSMPSQDFRRSLFRNARLGPIDDWLTVEHNSLVITSPGRLPPGWKVKDEIYGAAGKERYVAVETVRD